MHKVLANRYRQLGLRSGATEMVVNLLDHPKLKAGNSLTLKDCGDPKRWWTIVWVSVRTRARPNTRWNVGGHA